MVLSAIIRFCGFMVPLCEGFHTYDTEKMHWEDANRKHLLFLIVKIILDSTVVMGCLTSTERCAMFCPVAVKKAGCFHFVDEIILWSPQ